MERSSSRWPIVAIALAVTWMISGCGPDTSQVTSQATPVVDASVKDGTVIAVGEATHGNAEFVEVRRLMIDKLSKELDVTTVAIEADFGGVAAANSYLQGGPGSAEEAARFLGFRLYQSKQTANLLSWVRRHNDRAADDKKITMYGYDMQRYDQNKRLLLDYLNTVDTSSAESVRAPLAPLSDRAKPSNPQAKAAASAMTDLIASMSKNRADYIAASSEKEFWVARQLATTIRQGAELDTAGGKFSELRDAMMAENVQAIQQFAADQGVQSIMIAGHNGHIEKTGAAYDFPSMGERLVETYGDDYVAIGTEFGTSTFNARSSGTDRANFTINSGTPLAPLYGGEELGYVDLDAAQKAGGATEMLVNSSVSMGSAGEKFSAVSQYLPWTHRLKMVPAKAYDGLIYVPEATPIEML